MEYIEGTRVEVSSDDEGFESVWFLAMIIKATGNNEFLVEYQDLMDDENKLLRENVDMKHIRPIPPEISIDGGFYLFEEVDAWYNDGWWIGLVSEVLEDSRYSVYFRDSNEVLKFSQSELRPHQDWIDGKWIQPSKGLILPNY